MGEMQQKIRDWRRTGVSRSETQSESISGATGQAEWLLDSIRFMNREYEGLAIPSTTDDSRRYNFSLKGRNLMDRCVITFASCTPSFGAQYRHGRPPVQQPRPQQTWCPTWKRPERAVIACPVLLLKFSTTWRPFTLKECRVLHEN